ncbi:MAG TPA: hypothetical protein VGH48_14565, partial [Caldimonas sp.]
MKAILRTLAFIAAAAVAGCGGSDTLVINAGQLRLVNATSSFAGLDLFANSTAVATGVAPYSASGYTDLKADSYPLA